MDKYSEKDKLEANRANISYAHILSLLKDVIIFFILVNGRSAEKGTHSKLIILKNKCCALWKNFLFRHSNIKTREYLYKIILNNNLKK